MFFDVSDAAAKERLGHVKTAKCQLAITFTLRRGWQETQVFTSLDVMTLIIISKPAMQTRVSAQ